MSEGVKEEGRRAAGEIRNVEEEEEEEQGKKEEEEGEVMRLRLRRQG